MLESLAMHLLALVLLMLVPAQALRPPRPKEVEVVFRRPRPQIEVPTPAVLPPGPPEGPAPGPRPEPGGKPAPPVRKEPSPAAPELPAGPAGTPEAPQHPQQRVGNAGILAFRDKFKSLSKDKVAARLGADARYSAADEVGKPSARSTLMTNNPGSSGGINLASLSRGVGGGGGHLPGGGGGGGDGSGGSGGGLGVGRATSPINPGGDRPLARGGPGPSRTDEEIQIVFDRYKAQFYRLYNRELRKDPTLQGQMVLRLTIEPDGSVSMCKLQSSDMNAPELADQVVNIVLTINFGAKEGVQAMTIVDPIDFLPAT
jgi:hypothetical protein